MWLANSSTCSTLNADHSSIDLSVNDDDSIDPRVQDELERLNNATDVINKLEVELDDARAGFRQLLSESTQKINGLAKRLGTCVEKARPYYDARIKEKEAHGETQKAALRFERANSAHSAAKEMVFLAEEGLAKEGRTFDPVWQEMLNHATMRVNEAESERTLSEQEHRRISKSYNDAEKVVQELKKDLKKQITKSSLSARRNLLQINDLAHQHQLLLLPYFEMKAQFNKLMEEQKRRVQELEENVLRAKQSYADALHNLEEISDEIHQRRKCREERLALGDRGTGVGAEHPEPSLPTENNREGRRRRKEDENDSETIASDTYATLPAKLRHRPKSVSSSTLSQLISAENSGTQDTVRNGNHLSLKLRKSKSVVDRTDIGILFGRYSISKAHRLQVDSGSQTEEEAVTSRQTQSLERRQRSREFDCLTVPCERNNLTPASSKPASILNSENTSPSDVQTDGQKNLFLSSERTDDGETSDSASITSIDCLTDEQISSLMLDKGLEEVVSSLPWTTSIRQHIDGDGNRESFGTHQMTQTTHVQDQEEDEEEEADQSIVAADSEDEVTVIETIVTSAHGTRSPK